MAEKRDRRRLRRRAIVAFLVLLVLLQLTIYLPRAVDPPPPFSWLIRTIPATAAAIQASAARLGDAWDVYVDNVGASRELRDVRAELQRTRFALFWAERSLDRQRRIGHAVGWGADIWTGVVARVAYHDPGERFRSLWVQSPVDAGALVGHALVADGALVGRIVRANGNFGQALLIHDVESSVDVVSPDGIRGILRGTGGAEGRLYFVPRYEALESGMRLVTTGRDATFPSDVPVAVVTDVQRDPENLYLDATVEFLADPTRLAWTRTIPPETPFEARPALEDDVATR